jgi:hypothetical protein
MHMQVDMVVAALERIQAIASGCPGLSEGGLGVAMAKIARAAGDALALLTAEPEPMARFCPGCGSVGEVPSKYRDCCPDGGRARVIPESLAKHCRDLFQLAINAAAPAAPAQRNEDLKAFVDLCRFNSGSHLFPGWDGNEVAKMLTPYLAAPHTAPADDYKAWYEEAMVASNEAGFVGLTAAETIRELAAQVDKRMPRDVAGNVKLEASVLEREAVRLLNTVKAWYDSDGNERLPAQVLDYIEAVLMMAEQRRTGLTKGAAA